MGAETPINGLRLVPVGTLDKHGKAGWAQILALQFQVRITQLKRECDTWRSLGEAARSTEIWDELCREADRKLAAEAGRNRESPEVLRARRLLDADASLERCWAEINDPRNRPTPPTPKVTDLKRRLREFWAHAKAARDTAAADVFTEEFTRLANESGLTRDLGRHGAEDIAHVIRWAYRGWNPFESGPLK